jgi:hypothetical protein
MLVTWTEREAAMGREKKLNHLSLDRTGEHLLLSTAAGEIQVGGWLLLPRRSTVTLQSPPSFHCLQMPFFNPSQVLVCCGVA